MRSCRWQLAERAWSGDYAALDETCEGLTVMETEIGAFRNASS